MEIAYMLAGALCAMGGMIVARLIDFDRRDNGIADTANTERAKITPIEPSEEEVKLQKQWDELMDFDPLAKREEKPIEED